MGANISIFFYILSIRKVVCIINTSGSKFCAFLLSGVYSVFYGRLRALSWIFNWYELFSLDILHAAAAFADEEGIAQYLSIVKCVE